MWTPPVDQSLPADPPNFICPPRSAQGTIDLISQFGVGTSQRYARGLLNGQPSPLARSWCNLFVCDFTRAAGCPIPRMISGRYLDANQQQDWLLIAGGAEGWEQVSLERALAEVERGLIIIATWQNPDPKESGHVSVGRPAPRGPDGQLWTAQAGYRNFACGTLASGFGAKKKPLLWLHA